MFSSSITKRLRCVLLMLLAAGGAVLCSRPVSASLLRWAPGKSADQSKDILVYADKISHSKIAGKSVYLVRGRVWIGQGLVNVRFGEGVIQINDSSEKTQGPPLLEVYAEGKVYAEEGALNRSSDRAHLFLRTSGKVKFKPSDKRIYQQTIATEPLYERAVSLFADRPAGLPTTPAVISTRSDKQKETSTGKLPAPPRKIDAAKFFPDLDKTKVPRSVQDALRIDPAKSPIQLTGGLQQPETLPAPHVAEQQPVPPSPGLPGFGGISAAADRQYSIRPRSSLLGFQLKIESSPNGETAVIITNGIILTVINADGRGGILDIEADRLVFWTRGNHPRQILQDFQSNRSQKDRPWEFYLSGNVEIRTKIGIESRLLRADEVYYDVNRHVAVASHADLEVDDPRLKNPIHVQSEQILQLNQNLFVAKQSAVNASALPWDPALYLTVRDSSLETKPIVRRTIFGREIIDPKTGQPIKDTQRYFRGRNMVLWLHDVPIFYLPYVQGDIDDPLGPLENIGVNYNNIFGFQLYTTWDIYDLIGITALPGTRWRLNLDYLSKRGPAAGSDFTFSGTELLGIPNRYAGLIKAYGVYDTGLDIIGGNRGQLIATGPATPPALVPVTHPSFRGRFSGSANVQDLPYGFMMQTRWSYLSDKNFLEQYYINEFLNDLNQETYLYVKQQQGNWAWTGLVEPRIRDWVTETEWYPRFDGHLLGMKFFDLVTYNARASAGYAELENTDEPAFAYRVFGFHPVPTDGDVNTARLNLFQEASIPFTAGAFRLAPYGIVDLAYYSNDIFGAEQGRVYGAAGLRASLPMSRLYPCVQSEYFNVDGIFHKITFAGNFFAAQSDTSFRRLPQLDRFNDDASDQALRDLFPQQAVLNPANATALTTSPLFDPQVYALRRMILDKIDTLDDMQVLQLAVNQRWQTKRGFAGRQHIIDWMTLNLSGSAFPRADRDNFGETLAFLEYDWTWNIGDRTSLVSTGWIDPIDNGPRVWTVGANLNRPDESNLYVGYRQIDPLQSKAVISSLSYRFSPKYSATASASYDFGVDNQVTSFILTREGTDLRVSFGVTYNSILNNFGIIFEIMPNLFPTQLRSPGTAGRFVSAAGMGR